MLKQKNWLFVLILLLLVFSLPTEAKPKEKGYDAIVKHLKTKYRAKKVNIPFMWLARFAVGVVRPAGVKSFSVTLFENLKFSSATLDKEMQAAMRNSLSREWSPIFRVRSRQGQQAYMYMRDSGKNVKLMLVTIEENQAAVIRATLNPEKLAEFINEPTIFGISLNPKDEPMKNEAENSKTEENRKKEN